MTTKITPQEFHFEDTSDSVRVKTVVGKEFIDQAALMRNIRHFRLGAGTIIRVQVMTKDYDVLLHSADFVIERAVETTRQIIDERGERTARVTDYVVVQDTPWKSYSAAPVEEVSADTSAPEDYVQGVGVTKWNPGKRGFEVTVDGVSVAVVKKIEGETQVEFKARAVAIAAGSEPLSKAA